MTLAIEQIYDQITQVFGSRNPDQFFSMLMPATTLDQQTYAYDTTGIKPALVAEAESELVDQMFDLTPVTGSSNGQRVSEQYIQALSTLVPNFNPMVPVVKSALRTFLNSPMPPNTMLEEKPFTGSLQDYYFIIYGKWVALKLLWDQDQQAMKDEFEADPATANEKFLEWFEGTAEGRLAELDAAYGKILTVFAPSDMDAIMGTLAAGPGGEVDEAINVVKDIRLFSPSGGYVYPVVLTPDNWFLNLSSDIDPTDLLQDPQFIAADITSQRKALMASISQVQALLNTVPTPATMQAAVTAMNTAQSQYATAQNNLLGTYADNTATAAEIYISKHSSDLIPQSDADALAELNQDAAAASAAKGEQPPATEATDKNGTPITTQDVQAILAGQKNLIAAQSALLTSSQGLATAGLNLAAAQSQTFANLPILIARMQQQLGDLETAQQQLSASIVSNPAPIPTTVVTAAAAVVTAATTEAAVTTPAPATAADVVTAVTHSISLPANTAATQAALEPLNTAAANAAALANASANDVLTAVQTAAGAFSNPAPSAPLLSTSVATEAAAVVTAAQTAAAATSPAATPASVVTAVKTAVTASSAATQLAPLNTAATTAAAVTTATANDVAEAVTTAAQVFIGSPTAVKSPASAGFMELQLSFKSSEMQSDSSTSTQFSQQSWSVDCFFGGGSGSSSSSSSVTTANSLDQDTEIQVAFKAAKVDISREWFDPGVFKLTADMSRLSTANVSAGPLPVGSDGTIDWPSAGASNTPILPCFPVAFVVAKDVTIKFNATSSSLAAIHSVADSQSAAGGGFLCFSCSSSSASHSDSQSLSTKTEGLTVTIQMPGPQILGWFLEMTPADLSKQLLDATTQPTPDINLLKYVSLLQAPASPGVNVAISRELKSSPAGNGTPATVN